MPMDTHAPYCGTRNAFQPTYPLDVCVTNTGFYGDGLTGMDHFPLWSGIQHGCIFQPCRYRGYYDFNGVPYEGMSAAIIPPLPVSSSSGINGCIGSGSTSSKIFGYVHQELHQDASLDFSSSAPSAFELDTAGTLSETPCARPHKRSRKHRKMEKSRTRTNGGEETDNSLDIFNSTINFSSTFPGDLEGGKYSRIMTTGATGDDNEEISGSRFSATWTREEDGLLASAVARHGTESWIPASTFISGRTPMECASRWYGSLNRSFRRGRWTSQEDELVKNAVAEWVRSVVGLDSVLSHDATTTEEWLTRVDGCGGYKAVPWKEIAKATAHRNAVQCQTRWTESLDPHVKKSAWSPEEDEILVKGVQTWSHSWNRIAAAIPGRTQRQCRSRYIQISTQRELAESKSLVPASNDTSHKPQDPNFVPEFLQGNSNIDESFWTRYEDFVTSEFCDTETFSVRSEEPVEYPAVW